MPLWRSDMPIARGVMVFARRSTTQYTYRLDGNNTFPALTTATVKFYNTYGQEIASIPGVFNGNAVTFNAEPSVQEQIPHDSSFEVVVNYAGVSPQSMLWGNVVRDEARYPNEPVESGLYDAAQYEYRFLAPGRIKDPSWRILNGAPTVWDNSSLNSPNAAAAGILFDDAAMMWYAPMAGDSIKINYTLRNAGSGKCTMGFCSNYDGTNWIGVTHEKGISNNFLKVEIGRGPVNMSTVQTTPHTLTGTQNYTATYNSQTNQVAVYKGVDLTPLTTPWEDTTHEVDHGPGERYFMFNWRASLLAPGPELVSFKIIDDA